MAKRRRTVTRSHTSSSTEYRAGFSRGSSSSSGKRTMAPPSSRNNNRIWWIAGAIAVVLALGGLVYIYALSGTNAPGASAGSSNRVGGGSGPTVGPTVDAAAVKPPTATPLASPPAQPSGDGTTATIDTEFGPIMFEVYNQSAPVASQNFINLANANFYNGTTFHRIVPGFVIQGGDPNGNGSGGPGYTIPDEPVVGDYTREIVAMARTSQPNSAGSQFFIVLDDSVVNQLSKSGRYVIFGKVTQGMDVVDEISAGPASQQIAQDPTVITTVTIQPPGV
jgi:peptidyl-prolyl cis-trans isomerase B (cyclophilin B)